MHSKELLHYSKHLTLLLAEDHNELRESTTNILQNFFEKVDAACDGEEALTFYNENKYDIILTDIRMPKVDGISFVEAIYEKNPEQKVIVLSAHDESKYLIPLLNLGVEHYIKKPLDYQELIDVFYKVSKKVYNLSHKEEQTKAIQLAPDTLYDKDKKALLFGEKISYLTKYEMIFLDILTQQLNSIYSNDEIVQKYHDNGEKIDAQNIRKLVSKLRKKLPVGIIESIYGVGYRMIPKR